MTRRRTYLLALAGLAAALLVWVGLAKPKDAFLYNPSPSIPSGLYQRIEAPVTRGAIVTVRAAEVAPEYAQLRGFTDAGDRFIKRVVGVGGDRACAEGDQIILNDAIIARRRNHDADQRKLPSWVGCRTLGSDEMLLMGDTDDSFDGRYWGVIPAELIEGVWRPLF
jgi:conjugative transfer signal peptidase TraF